MADETIDKKTLFKKCAEVMYGFGCKLLSEIAEHKDVDEVYVHMFITHGSVMGVLLIYESVFGKDENYNSLKEECDKIIRDTQMIYSITCTAGDDDDD